VKEQEIPGLGFPAIARDEYRVVVLQRTSIGVLGELRAGDVILFERAVIGAEESLAQDAVAEPVPSDIGSYRLVSRADSLKPGTVVSPKRFTQGEAYKPRTIPLFPIPFTADTVELQLGYRGEPSSKIAAVVKRAKLGAVWNPIRIGIAERRLAGSCFLCSSR
jgi:hypothetical protein